MGCSSEYAVTAHELATWDGSMYATLSDGGAGKILPDGSAEELDCETLSPNIPLQTSRWPFRHFGRLCSRGWLSLQRFGRYWQWLSRI